MPLTHTRTFRVRYYECDARGYLNHTNYLRYMQEAAFDASAAAGYGLARYTAMGRFWLVRETDIEYLRPLYYEDSVEVKTWVADFRRVRSRRLYEFRLVGSGELVARGNTDWAFLESATGRPAVIPTEMVATFLPEGRPAAVLPRGRFPVAAPPSRGVFRIERRVGWGDLDPAQHVNNAVYLTYLEDCGVRALAASGWPPDRMRSSGFGFEARRHQIEYLQPALLDDELELATWASGLEQRTLVRDYTIARVGDDALLARGRMVDECVELSTGQPMPLPPSFLEDVASIS